MRTRNGKIARLPREFREHLNRRLEDGEQGKHLVEWLNASPEVQAVLAAEFEGRPVSEQNLSEWKQGGYREWQRQQERHARVRQLTEDADELNGETGGVGLSDRLSVVLAAELAQAAQERLDETTDSLERWKQLQEVLRELARLRREDHKVGRLQLEREQWEEKQAEARATKAAFRTVSPPQALLTQHRLIELFGQVDPFSQAMAIEIAQSMLLGNARSQPGAAHCNPTWSNPVKPNQTE